MRASARVSAGIALAASVALATVARDGQAYCRTTTLPAPPGYDPAQSGCWTEGKPLAWTDGLVSYSLARNASRQISLEDASRVAALAFGSWNAASCAGNASPGVLAYDSGPAPAASAECSPGASCTTAANLSGNVIAFDDDAWPYDDPANTLALTTVTFAVDSGLIMRAFIEVNTFGHQLTTTEPPPDGQYDLQAILTHEAGHFLGLAHATNPGSIMYAFYRPGAVTLTADDIAGICTVYPPSTVPGCTCAAAPRPPSAAAMAAALAVAVAAMGRRRRRASAS